MKLFKTHLEITPCRTGTSQSSQVYSCLTSLYLSSAITWPQEINLRGLTAAIKLFSLTLTLRSSPLSAERSVSLPLLSPRLKREEDGAVFISSGDRRGLLCRGRNTQWGPRDTPGRCLIRPNTSSALLLRKPPSFNTPLPDR